MITELTPVQGAEEQHRSEKLSLRPLRPPTQVPGYEPECFLGRGAFGEVWVAADRNTGRRVAIKFYTQRGGLDWSLLSREVEKLAFLFNDRYVVQLIEVGWEAEPPYYVMEYLERGSLEERLHASPLPVDEAVALFREVAVGLVHAHGKGILHCDLKPANILLDQDGKPRLADFGQARLSHDQSPALGTLFYMAPEQANLKAVADARWDVYALGALLYRMLTGQPPYRDQPGASDISTAAKLEERLERYRYLLNHAPLPSAHRKVPGVDRALAGIIDHCLAVKPSKRFPNVQAVLSALNARALRHARRPLLILGALGPAISLLILGLLAWRGFHTTVEESKASLTARTIGSNRFASMFVAQAIARQIDQRWRILEQEASEDEFRGLLLGATGRPWGHESRQQLQAKVERLREKHQDSTKAYFWFLDDARGNQLALAPYARESKSPTIGKNFAYRTYFNGDRHDRRPGMPAEPIRWPHLSKVFQSSATQTRMVAFSVPVWDGDEDKKDRQVIGVLVLALQLGELDVRFGGDRGDADGKEWCLVDIKEDEPGKRGLVLQHPSAVFRAHAVRETAGDYRWPEALVERTEQLTRCRCTDDPSCDDNAALPDYQDPLAEVDERYTGAWLAAVEPILIDGRDPKIRNTGWVVVVQERLGDALRPVSVLRGKLWAQGLLAFGCLAAIVTGVWGFVLLVLHGPAHSRLAAFLRRRAGLPTNSLVSGTGGSSVSQTRSGGSGGSTARRRGTVDGDPAAPGRGKPL